MFNMEASLFGFVLACFCSLEGNCLRENMIMYCIPRESR